MDIGFQPLRYLIGGDDSATDPMAGGIVEYSYDKQGACRIKYGTLTDEKGRFNSLEDANHRGQYGPYLQSSDITDDYGEWMPDPNSAGFMRNVMDQLKRAKAQGALVLEMDNPDFEGLPQWALHQVLDVVALDGLQNVCKNPLNVADPEGYAAHPSIALVVAEQGDYSAHDHEALRQNIKLPLLPIRFVTFGSGGQSWAQDIAHQIMSNRYLNMGVTWSRHEYDTAVDIIKPKGSNIAPG